MNGSPDSRLARRALIEQTLSRFGKEFGGRPDCVACAPGRVNLVGEHTDYNLGLALPMAINRYTVAAVRRRSGLSSTGRGIDVATSVETGRKKLVLGQPAEHSPGAWHGLLIGILAGLRQQGVEIPDAEVMFHTNLPIGAGLSSSAAFAAAFASAILGLTESSLDPFELARLCQQAEHDYRGVPCGLMDPLCSVMGQFRRLLLMDFHSLDVQFVPFEPEFVSVLLVDSSVDRSLAKGDYALRCQECEHAARLLGFANLREAFFSNPDPDFKSLPSPLSMRVAHVRDENLRVQAMVEACKSNDWDRAGEILFAGHQSLCSQFEVSCPELDCLVEIAAEIGKAGGILGARMTGGGFGGCTVNLIRRDHQQEIQAAIHERYFGATGRIPHFLPVEAAEGVTVELVEN